MSPFSLSDLFFMCVQGFICWLWWQKYVSAACFTPVDPPEVAQLHEEISILFFTVYLYH